MLLCPRPGCLGSPHSNFSYHESGKSWVPPVGIVSSIYPPLSPLVFHMALSSRTHRGAASGTNYRIAEGCMQQWGSWSEPPTYFFPCVASSASIFRGREPLALKPLYWLLPHSNFFDPISLKSRFCLELWIFLGLSLGPFFDSTKSAYFPWISQLLNTNNIECLKRSKGRLPQETGVLQYYFFWGHLFQQEGLAAVQTRSLHEMDACAHCPHLIPPAWYGRTQTFSSQLLVPAASWK